MLPELNNPADRSARGWVLYDGHCGFCSAGMRRMAGVLKELNYAAVPLQAGWVIEKLGTELAVNPREMLLLTGEGKLVAGVDAYLHVASELWWARPLAWVGRWGPVHGVLVGGYRWVAAHRTQISVLCRLKPELREGGGP